MHSRKMPDLSKLTFTQMEGIGLYYDLCNIVARIQLQLPESSEVLMQLLKASTSPSDKETDDAMITFVGRLLAIANSWPDPKDYSSMDEYLEAAERACVDDEMYPDDLRPVD